MSNYSQTTDFSAKDSLPSGNAAKVIKGSDVDTEFEAIATAIATKKDTAGADVPTGSMMLFVQTAAPSGWRLVTTWNDVVPLIVSSGSGSPDTGGQWEIEADELTMTLPSTTITLPAHLHAVGTLVNDSFTYAATAPATGTARYCPAQSSHTHVISGSTANTTSSTTVTSTAIVPSGGTMESGDWRPKHVEVIVCEKT